jgi:hypothetical protein
MVTAKGFVDTWIFSVGAMLFILGILAVFGALLSVLMSRIWGEAPDEASTARMSKELSIRLGSVTRNKD